MQKVLGWLVRLLALPLRMRRIPIGQFQVAQTTKTKEAETDAGQAEAMRNRLRRLLTEQRPAALGIREQDQAAKDAGAAGKERHRTLPLSFGRRTPLTTPTLLISL